MDSVKQSATTLTEIEQKRLRELEEAFALFNQTSQQLTQAYTALQQQLAAVQKRLVETEQQRRQVSERLEQLLDLLPAGVIVLDETNRIIDMNPSAEGILGKDAWGRDWDIVVRNVFLRRNSAGELITHDGRAYQQSETPLQRGVGKILLIQDVTAARQLQAHISRHQRLSSMGDMAASLAHQIRTPLSTALLYVSQLGQSLPEEQRHQFAEKAQISLRHIEGLIKDMLQYVKGGKTAEKLISANDLLSALQQAALPLAEAQGADLIIHFLEQDVKLLGDQDALLTALQNLVNNALEIIGRNARIEVLGEVDNNQLILRVIDNGPGIDETLQEKVFEPFFTSRARGTGLGLAVVRAVVEAHGGEVCLHSIPGVGSTFSLIFPLTQRAVA